jgi:Uma2 family endonuclease
MAQVETAIRPSIATPAPALRWTSADWEVLPNDGKRYEIIDGELHVSEPPSWQHQFVCCQFFSKLQAWSTQCGKGQANVAPDVIFADDDDVAPDVVWISRARRDAALGIEGHLHAAPELVIEVLSFGLKNEQRDRDAKLKLYSRRGVQEYWIADWRMKQIEIYRRTDQALQLIATLLKTDTVTTPLLPGFACSVASLFDDTLSG